MTRTWLVQRANSAYADALWARHAFIEWMRDEPKSVCVGDYSPYLEQVPGPHSAVKAGVHLKAVFTPPKIGLTEISRSRFKQYKNPTLITQINVLGCFVIFFGNF